MVFLVLFLAASLANGTHSSGIKNGSLSPNSTTSTGHAAGSGYAYAESCQAALRQWSKSSSSYGHANGHRSTSYFSSSMTVKSINPGSTKVTSLITLCDGHPRVVGQISTEQEETRTYVTSWTDTNPTFVFATYPTPAPCSIGPEDCELLYSSWTSHYYATTHTGGLLDPPCTTKTSSRSYSTDSAGHVCDNCQVLGSKIRLLYWPIITKAGSGNLCNKSADTISAAPTGSGPNTFVTLGVTITSPSVAVSIGGLSRVDQCGTTVAETIIPVLPEDVSSVEGARALFTHRPFNFANLNYKCMSDPHAIYITTSGRSDCYQEVPASAYFYGYANAAGAEWWSPEAFANSTIWPNYQPQVLPPNTLTQAIRSLWGSGCNIHPDGVWDPPIALGQVKSIPLPTAPNAPPEYWTPSSNPAVPALPTYAQPSVTYSVDPPTTADPGNARLGATATGSPDGHDNVHVIHTTIVTLPAKNGEATLTAIYGADGTSLVNGESTIRLSEVGAGSTMPQASYDPKASLPVHQQLITVGGAEYTIEPLAKEGFELIGQSTTLRVHDSNMKTTRSAGHLTLATREPSQGSKPGDALSSPTGGHSASNSGVGKALQTCFCLSVLAMVMVIFL